MIIIYESALAVLQVAKKERKDKTYFIQSFYI